MTRVLLQHRLFAWAEVEAKDLVQVSIPMEGVRASSASHGEAKARTWLLCQQDLRNFPALLPSHHPFQLSARGYKTELILPFPIFQSFPLTLPSTAWLCGGTRRRLCPRFGGCGMWLAGTWQGCCSPHHTRGNQSPVLKASCSAEVLPGGSARAALLLLCLNAGPFVDSEAPTP